jgi:ubiquitin
MAINKPKTTWGYQKMKEAKKDLSPTGFKRRSTKQYGPIDTLVSDLQM